MLVGSGAPIQVLDDDRAAALLFVGSATEPGPGAAPLATELGFPRSPLVEAVSPSSVPRHGIAIPTRSRTR